MIIFAPIKPFVAIESIGGGGKGRRFQHFAHYHSVKVPALSRADIRMSNSKFLDGFLYVHHLKNETFILKSMKLLCCFLKIVEDDKLL